MHLIVKTIAILKMLGAVSLFLVSSWLQAGIYAYNDQTLMIIFNQKPLASSW